jgi:putative endonuclease
MFGQKSYWVYIMTNRKDGALYIGVTSDLIRRVMQHRTGIVDGFSKQYRLKKLVYYEEGTDVFSVIQREKSLKTYPRQWKINLINGFNPAWIDLYPKILGVTS